MKPPYLVRLKNEAGIQTGRLVDKRQKKTFYVPVILEV